MNLRRQLVAFRYVPIRKPRFLLRLARFYLRAWSGCDDLRYVDFNITGACNLSCQHCFAEEIIANGEPMIPLEYMSAEVQAKRLGALHLSLQGGEPTLAPHLFDIIQALGPKDCMISLTTNGTLLTPELCRKLYRAGVDLLVVSVDSMFASEHDAFRGKEGALAKTIAGIGHARMAGLGVQINCCVHHRNLGTPGFEALVNWCIQNRLLLNLVYAAPIGAWSEASDDILLTAEDVRRIRCLIASTPWVRHDNDAVSYNGRCPIGSALYIRQNGDVDPCPFIRRSFGNLRHESLRVIRERMLSEPWVSARTEKCLAAEPGEFRDKMKNPVR